MTSELKTSGIKLSEIRPCDNCGGKIAPVFTVLELKTAAFNQRNVNSVMETLQILGGRALQLAEAMADGADDAVEVLENREAVTRIFLCQECAAGSVDLAIVRKKVHDLAEKRQTSFESPGAA